MKNEKDDGTLLTALTGSETAKLTARAQIIEHAVTATCRLNGWDPPVTELFLVAVMYMRAFNVPLNAATEEEAVRSFRSAFQLARSALASESAETNSKGGQA